jgi:trigger factor
MNFTSTIEEVDPVTKRISVSIPPSNVEQEISVSLDNVSRQVSIKGFRPGKAPKYLVQKLHGDLVKGQVAEKLISNSLEGILKEHQIDMVGSPEIEGGLVESGKALEFKATISVFPKPEVKGYDSFELRVGRRSPTDASIDEVIERMRNAKATMKPLAFRETAAKGDVVELGLITALEGEPEGRPEPVSVLLGEGQLPPGLEEGIVGMKVGETKDVRSIIPADHRDPKLRGKDALHRVTLNSLSERVLPEVNDEFAKSLELGVETLLELRMKVRESLERESERQSKVDAEAALLEQLVERNPFDVPKVLVDEEIRALVARSGLTDPAKVRDPKFPVQLFREGLSEPATKRVKTAILVDRIGDQEKVEIGEEDLKSRISEIARDNQVGEGEVTNFLAQEGRMLNLILEMRRTKTIAMLMERAKIEYFEKPAEEAESK